MNNGPATDLRLPRYQQLRDNLAADIAKENWRPDEPIPTEVELAKTHGVAIGTVRKAIEVLVAEGVLERFQGRGTFVRRANFDASLFRFFRFQMASGERRIPTSRILRREVVVAPAAVASILELARGDRVICLSRLRLIDGKPMLAEEIWLPFNKFEPFAKLDLNKIGDLLYPVYEAKCGQVIASASEDLAIELVTAPCARLLGLKPGTPVVVIERLAYGHGRKPLEWRRSRGPADEFRYHVDIR